MMSVIETDSEKEHKQLIASLRADAGDDYQVQEGKLESGQLMVATIGKGLLRIAPRESWSETEEPELVIDTVTTTIELETRLNEFVIIELNDVVGSAFDVTFTIRDSEDGISLVIEGANSSAAKQEIKQFIQELQKLPDFWVQPVKQLWQNTNFAIHELDPQSDEWVETAAALR